MTAVVVEGPDLALPISHHEDALVPVLVEEVAPRLRELGQVPGEEPASTEDALLLRLENLGRREVLPRQSTLAECCT
jgi:hypothetical protein